MNEGNVSSDRLLKARELSKKIGLPLSTVYRMAANGLIPSIAIGPKLGGVRFDEGAVRAAMNKLVRPEASNSKASQ